MRFDFTPDQTDLQAAVARLFSSEAAPAILRSLWTDPLGRNPRLWRGLGDIGIPAILIAEEYDGIGGDETDLILVLEDAGRFCVPDALLEASVLVPTALALSDSEELRRRWLPRLASGEARGTLALADTRYVPDVHVSDLIILERDGAFFLYERDELQFTPVVSMDGGARLFDVSPLVGAGVRVGDAELVGSGVRPRRDAGSAAILNGVAAAMVAKTVDHVKVREQFGRPLGSFQAVKQQLAQAESRNALSRQAARSALLEIAQNTPAAADAATLAKICAIEAEFESNRVALQLHGGIGFTWEYDLQFWLKRGKALEQSHGTHGSALSAAGGTGVSSNAHTAV